MMESEQTAGSCPAPGQATVRTWLPSSPRGSTKAPSDAVSRFQGDGVRYKAKIIGVDPVPDSQGEKMCLDSMMKLKGFEAAARKQGKHKQRVWLKISSGGLKMVDERTGSILHEHERSRISSLTKDESDPRALAYVYQQEDTYALFYIRMANMADPVVADITEVCQSVDQETPQEEPAETQNTTLLLINDNPVVDAEGPDLEDVFSPRPVEALGKLNHANPTPASSSNELLEVFSAQMESPLTPTQNASSSPSVSPQPTLSTSQILSMFSAQPMGGSPYSSPPYSPTSMPWGQQGPLGNQWAGGPQLNGPPMPPMPGGPLMWAPPGMAAPPAGGLTQPHTVVNPHLGVMMGGNAAGFPTSPTAPNGYPAPLNSLYPPTGPLGPPQPQPQSVPPTLDQHPLL
ncbi:disabled homolog 1-like [Mugil cephalus]|uniref:disabled homolog 1-like n=1 Tax=Mugil cephalus TaxID=48193 RepID=UPI001FB812BC|nr:disabled homolog 1-like [Mugil cephalus]XP_047443774.1 disabled homolog 1-like [Mugil cephalus]